MEKSDFIGKNAAELKAMRLGFEKELFNFRFQKVAQPLENPARIRTVRRMIARIKTRETWLSKESVSGGANTSSKKTRATSKAAR